MTPEMLADAARAFGPRILYPYNHGCPEASGAPQGCSGNPSEGEDHEVTYGPEAGGNAYTESPSSSSKSPTWEGKCLVNPA